MLIWLFLTHFSKNWKLAIITQQNEIWFTVACSKNMQNFWINNVWETLKNVAFQYSNNCSCFYYYYVSFSCLFKHPNSLSQSLLFKADAFRIMLFNVVQGSVFLRLRHQIQTNIWDSFCISIFWRDFWVYFVCRIKILLIINKKYC